MVRVGCRSRNGDWSLEILFVEWWEENDFVGSYVVGGGCEVREGLGIEVVNIICKICFDL